MAGVVIQIGKASGTPASYPVSFARDNVVIDSQLVPVPDLPPAIRNDFLRGGVAAVKLMEHGRTLYNALHKAIGHHLGPHLDSKGTTYLDIADPDLVKFPWELMMRDDSWVALQSPIVRVNAWKPSFSGPGALWPLRVMILIGTDDLAIAAREEERRIREELSAVHSLFLVRTLFAQDRPIVTRELGEWQPHILHFIGHGGQAGGLPRLHFDSPNSWDWTTLDIKSHALFDSWRPTLVVLNACRSVNPNDDLEIVSVGSAFLARGCPAVIGMQADIKGATAGVYAGKLYENLAKSTPLHLSLQAARNAVYDFSSTGVANTREAAMASLTVCVPPEALFAPVLKVTDELKQKLMKFSSFEVISHFVNQVERREQIVTSLWPIVSSVQRRPMVILRGDESTGKTSLACLLMDLCLRTYHKVRYIDVNDGNPKNWLDVLRLIRGRESDQVPIREPLPRANFNEFHWQINAWLSGKEPAVWDQSSVDDRELPLSVSENIAKEPASAGEPLGGAFQGFRRALESVASAEHPLTIVLDNLSGLDHSNFWLLWDGLFQPIANGAMPNLHLLLILTTLEYTQKYKIDEGVQQSLKRFLNFAVCNIPLLTPDDFTTLAPELFERLYAEVDINDFKGYFKTARSNVFRQDWAIGKLRELYDSLEKDLHLVRRPL